MKFNDYLTLNLSIIIDIITLSAYNEFRETKRRKGGCKMGEGVIEVNALTKDYGSGRGVFDVSFSVNRGEVFGFLGPNGAGKTTTIRHIMGFSRPQSGATSVYGKDSFAYHSDIMKDLGYLPGEIALPEGLSGWDFIRMMQKLKNCTDEGRLKYLLEKFELDPSGSLKRMSIGVKRKLAVVTAFMHDDDVLILDEPTSGLDPIMQETFIEFVKEEKARGKTILLSSHIFSEIDATCDRIAIIKNGKIMSVFVADDIRYNQNKTFRITFADAADYAKFMTYGFRIVHAEEQNRTIKFAVNDADVNALIRDVAALSVTDFTEEKFTLEDYFMRFYYEEKEFGGVR